MPRFYVDDKGFTLLEVMTSMVIMAVSLLILLHLAMIALDGNRWASGTTSSTQLLQEKLENLKNSSNPISGADTVGTVTRHWEVSSAGAHLKEIVVTASWLTPDSITQSYSISTIMKTDLP